MKVYQDLNPRGLASKEYGGITFRTLMSLSEGMPDDQLRHALYNTGRRDDFFSWKVDGKPKMVTMNLLSHQAKAAGINFVVSNSTERFWNGTGLISVDLHSRASGHIADLLEDDGWTFDTAAIAIFNEPGKGKHGDGPQANCGPGIEGAKKYVEYVKAADALVKGRFPLWIICDEYHLIDEEYVFTHLPNIPKERLVFAVHHLSSLGKTPAWKHVEYAATQAATWGVKVVCNEGGAWFNPYRSTIGHGINIRLLKECADWGYDACAIVAVQNNEYTIAHNWGTLGYLVYNNDYTSIVKDTEHWKSFIDVVKTYKESELPMPEDRILKLTSPIMYGDDVKECQGHLLRLGFDLAVDGGYGNRQSVPSVKKFQELKGLVQDGWVGPITWKALRGTEVNDFYPEVFQDIYTKRDYSIALIDRFLSEYASTALLGHGKFFKDAENTYGEPVEWQLADAWQESVLGTSWHGRTKNNLYGWGITDSGVMGIAYFDTFAECINHVAMKVKQLYFTEGAIYNNGLHIFGKEIKYSTAPYNAIMKAKYYRLICSIIDAYEEPSPPVPATMEELLAVLDGRYVIKT